MRIHVDSIETIWQKAAEFLLELLVTHQNEKVLLLLSGGSAVKLYDRIKYYVSSITDNYLAIAQVDERFQPVNNDDVNAITIGKTGLWEACEKKNIPYCLISQEGTLKEAAEKYNNQIASLIGKYPFKIGVFGIGEDAHTAGLLPGYEKEWNTDKLVVGYDTDKQRQNSPAGLICPQIIRHRITVTPKALRQLDHAIVVAIGEKKRGAIENALNPMSQNNLNKYPAVILQKIKKVDLFTDIKDL
jgi:6-phosphogluconolactonase/glucosamine-6-phosphate isomerase/deaminase